MHKYKNFSKISMLPDNQVRNRLTGASPLIPLVRIKHQPIFWRFWDHNNAIVNSIAFNYFDLSRNKIMRARAVSIREFLGLPENVLIFQLGIAQDDVLARTKISKYISDALYMGVNLIIPLDHSLYLLDNASWRSTQIIRNVDKHHDIIRFLERKGFDAQKRLIPLVIGTDKDEIKLSFKLLVIENGFTLAAFNVGFWLRMKYYRNIYAFINLCAENDVIPIIINAGAKNILWLSSLNSRIKHITHYPVLESLRSHSRIFRPPREIILEIINCLNSNPKQLVLGY